ncbi:P-loop containing nucleoside triphosphate hydrolase protein [Suillus clintonianus]|uniref:P-loop containing nucleoside triphosphate hydrolase protein n=1 Tax=Suillus clintonianus TaxID=1904413 RepID=UPI001B866719|nr:P-loop containing nucleoside triphosphate hydrolase protein [Suillus clintonianus]KAG2153284.1 P-loop containing nucleoside triphosphate hydrolase protein [Suillus clintonianus]
MNGETHPPAVQHMAQHVLNQLQEHRSRYPPSLRPTPLFVGVQGPQGSGKTFLTSRLRTHLSSPPHALSVTVLSIDDLYLPHSGLQSLAESHPNNILFQGRGQPGTHDVPLGTSVLKNLKKINDVDAGAVDIPFFDKSLFNGKGDRVSHGETVKGPVDVVVLEGWCVGFFPTSKELVEERWKQPVPTLEPDIFDMKTFVSVDHVLAVNERLKRYVEWWDALDAFIQIKGPSSAQLSIIYKWRLQQEHHMKAKNGGKGMTDDQVKIFVDRYIPGYVFFGDGVTIGLSGSEGAETERLPSWIGKGLSVTIGDDRELLHVSNF